MCRNSKKWAEKSAAKATHAVMRAARANIQVTAKQRALRRKFERVAHRLFFLLEHYDFADPNEVNRLSKTLDEMLVPIAIAEFKSHGDPNSEENGKEAAQEWHYKMFSGKFVTYWKTIPRVPFYFYAMTVLRHACCDIARRPKQGELHGADLVDRRQNPSSPASRAESKAIIHKAMEKLPPDQRDAIHAKFFEGLRNRDAAEIRNLNPSTLAVKRQRGLERLCRDLENHRGDIWPCDSPE